MKKLSKGNHIYYKRAASIEHLTLDPSVETKIGKWVRSLVYSINFVPLVGGNHTYYVLSDTFLREIKAIDMNIDVNLLSMTHKIINRFDEIRSARILILCGGVVGTYVERSEYTQQMDTLIALLLARFGYDALAIKTHPRFNEYYSKENSLKRIPADIAANLVLSHFDTVIGYSTAALAEAANAGKKAISLLRLMAPTDCYVRDSCIAYLNNAATKPIYYPESGEELLAVTEKQ